MEFVKYQALGNDYIVVDPENNYTELTKEKIKFICDRHFGIGSDGILYGPWLKKEKIFFRIFNPDGSEAEKSGNGIRIFAKYLVDSGHINSNYFSLETLGGTVHVEIIDSEANLIKVNMGLPSFDSQSIPVKGVKREVINEELIIEGIKYKITCVSIGNPHCVIPLEDISPELISRLGPKIENHELFANRINVQLLRVIDKNNIEIQIWERGAGYTLASGSSSCAAAIVAQKLGLADCNIKVRMPGGKIDIEITDEGIYMTGLVKKVFDGSIII